MTTDEIVANIDERLRQANDQITQLQHARHALADAATPRTTPRPRPTRSRSRRTSKTRSNVVPIGKLIGLLDGSDGLTTRELATQTGCRGEQILARLKEQEQAGNVRRTGARAATRWHLITDEDRIADRAAELSKRAVRT